MNVRELMFHSFTDPMQPGVQHNPTDRKASYRAKIYSPPPGGSLYSATGDVLNREAHALAQVVREPRTSSRIPPLGPTGLYEKGKIVNGKFYGKVKEELKNGSGRDRLEKS